MTAEVTTKRQASRFSEIFEDLLTFAPSGSSFVASIQVGRSAPATPCRLVNNYEVFVGTRGVSSIKICGHQTCWS